MARRPQTSPRKMASQKRSRATVDALVEATARILMKEGYDRASTNKIAAMAGVSIGSLYQYFPSKEALVAAVIERHTQELSQVVRDALLKVAPRPIEIGGARTRCGRDQCSPRRSEASPRPRRRGSPHRAARKYRGRRAKRLRPLSRVSRGSSQRDRGRRSRPRGFHPGNDGGGADACRSPASPGHPR